MASTSTKMLAACRISQLPTMAPIISADTDIKRRWAASHLSPAAALRAAEPASWASHPLEKAVNPRPNQAMADYFQRLATPEIIPPMSQPVLCQIAASDDQPILLSDVALSCLELRIDSAMRATVLAGRPMILVGKAPLAIQ